MSIELFKQLYEATLEMVETTFRISQEFEKYITNVSA